MDTGGMRVRLCHKDVPSLLTIRIVVTTGSTLASIQISYATPSLRHGTVYSARAALSTIISDYCGAKNETSQP